MILAYECVRGQQRAGANHLRIAGRHVEGVDRLMLRLSGVVLVVGIGDIEVRLCRLQIQVKGRRRSCVRVETVEQRRTVTMIVHRLELWRIQKAIRLHAVDRYEVAEVVRAATEVEVGGRTAE